MLFFIQKILRFNLGVAFVKSVSIQGKLHPNDTDGTQNSTGLIFEQPDLDLGSLLNAKLIVSRKNKID